MFYKTIWCVVFEKDVNFRKRDFKIMTSSNGSQQRKFIIRAIFIKHQSLSSSENLGIVKFYLLKNNEYYININ